MGEGCRSFDRHELASSLVDTFGGLGVIINHAQSMDVDAASSRCNEPLEGEHAGGREMAKRIDFFARKIFIFAERPLCGLRS